MSNLFAQIIAQKKGTPSPLPSGYTKCNFIETKRTHFIDTGISVFLFDDWSIKVNILATQFYDYNGVWDTAYNSDSYESWIYKSGNLAARYNGVRFGVNPALHVNEIYDIEYRYHDGFASLYIDDVPYGEITIPKNAIDYPILLGDGHPRNTGSMLRWYGSTLSADGMEVQNLVPVIDDSGRPCMYDTISHETFYNAGTGEFGYETKDGEYVAPV